MWEFDHLKVPLSGTFIISQITPPSGSFKVQIPAISVPGVTPIQAQTFDVPFRSTAPWLPETMKYTLGKIQADANTPRLHFRGTGKVLRKEIELTFKVNAAGELLGEVGKEFEKEASINIVKFAINTTLKAAVKFMFGAEAGIKATFEILYLAGYEVKQL